MAILLVIVSVWRRWFKNGPEVYTATHEVGKQTNKELAQTLISSGRSDFKNNFRRNEANTMMNAFSNSNRPVEEVLGDHYKNWSLASLRN